MQQGAARRINIAIDMTQNLQDPGQSVSDVVKFVNTVEQASGQHLFFVEEVLGPTKVKDYPLLRQQLNVKVAGGEIVTTPQELIERIASGTYDIVQPDATVIGGISAVTEVINTARRYITETVVHCWGGPVGMMANYHAALAGGSTLVEWPMPQFVLREAMVVDSWRIEKGQLWLSEAPGLGVELSPEVEQAFAFQEDAIYHCFARSRAMYQESQWLS
jgi:L-alanine-DL-glutamate epimerase-like enolase superfamily enzyme